MDFELEGTLLHGRAFEPVEGRVIVEDGTISAVEEGATDSTDVICPAFVNAHTHLGDSIAKEAGAGLSLDDLVAPPDGLKHRLLRAASREETVAAVARTLSFMRSAGTGAFVEFREGGEEGVDRLRAALARADADLTAVVLGRETAAAMRAADGFGASGARDGAFGDLRAATRAAGKLFGIHAGERDPDDIHPALELDPDFLVHLTHAEPDHIDRLARAGIPAVVCPRSNLVTDVGLPPVEELVDRTTVALGTDNVMLNSPSMFRELEFAAKLYDLPAAQLLRMATVNGAEIAGLDCGLIEPGREARLLVVDGDSDNLTGTRDVRRALVRRAGVADVTRVVTPDRPPAVDD
jgi:cytosine/adenosine deaminase-related metal-dependent hydrolase